MRTKIKLINICIRHRCSKINGELSNLKSSRQFQHRIIKRVKRAEAEPTQIAGLTSNTARQNLEISFESSNEPDSIRETLSDEISSDAGMRRLHRRYREPGETVKFDFPKTEKTLIVKSGHNDERVESLERPVSSLTNDVQEKFSETEPGVRSESPETETSEDNGVQALRNSEYKTEQSFLEYDFSHMERVPLKPSSDVKKNNSDRKLSSESGRRISNKSYGGTIVETENLLDEAQDEVIRKQMEKHAKDGNARFNELNMQMLSRRLYEQVFPNSRSKEELPRATLQALRKELLASGMNLNDINYLADADITLPAFEGKDVEEHFYNIASNQTKHYQRIIHEAMAHIPEMPDKWLMQEGWTRYTKDGAERVDYPLEDGIIFDVEVCMKEGPLPTLATAMTKDAWYSWVSKSLVDGNSIPVESLSLSTDFLIPLESRSDEHGGKLTEHHRKPKIIVGHNVCYDRRRIKEQYWLNCTGARFVDTMSLHVCVSGLNSYQRAVLKTEKHEGKRETWESVTSLNNLADVYRLYCGRELDKNSRNVFVEGSLNDVREQFDTLMKYCASDVLATHEVLMKLYPMFEERFPHPVTLAGMLELGSAYLPVNSNWQRYIEESQSTFEDLNYEAKNTLSRRADEVCKMMHNEKYKEDLWMWDQDWSTQPVKVKASLTKAKRELMEEEKANEKREPSDFEKYLSDGEEDIDPLEKQFEYLNETRHYLPAKFPHMSGYPAWYRKLCLKYSDENWVPGPQNISTSMQIAPKLLNLTWENYPLHYIKEHGWGFLVPYSDYTDEVETNLPLKNLLAQCPLPESGTQRDEVGYAMSTLRTDVQNDLTKTEFWRHKKKKTKSNAPQHFYQGSGIWCDVDIDNCCWFFKLPHKDGASFNVGNPLARDFLNKFSENVLVGRDSSATQVLKIARTVSYWRNNRDRIMSQMVVWLKDESLPSATRKSGKKMRYGAIIPQVVVSGTLTRRATEPTWMTASNASAERVGSELRCMVQAPPGYNIVGADVDSQELWIASVVGDSYCAGIHGATPFGWMTLIGTKSNGTDMHSVTAKAVGISRDHAKIINYARIYGAGQKFAERLLKQFNPSMSEAEATSKSRKMFALTKGKRIYRLKQQFVNDDVEDREYSSYETWNLAKVHGKTTNEMFETGRWCGGTESAMFNRLEEIAGNPQPVTPFLNSRLSRALETYGERDDKYLPTKINWVVQSGAVDFLHLMLVSMRWLMRDNARFCLSFHDEVRYIVPTRYKYNAALAMHVTNLLTRAFCSSRLGIKDLPMSVAFFASVEVDTVLRKESGLDCKTPSNPHGLDNGYGIPADNGGTMSRATKRKHVTKEAQEDLRIPTEEQTIVRLVDSRGNNLHEVVDDSGERYLVSMPVKFRRNIWAKRGDYVLVEPIAEGDKVKAEIAKILTRDHIKFYRTQNCWPKTFDDETSDKAPSLRTKQKAENESSEDDRDELFVNTNRQPHNVDGSKSGSSSSESSDSD